MLTPSQLDFFHTNGYLVLRGVVRGRELQMLQDAADAVIAEGLAAQPDPAARADHRYAPGPDGREVYWRSERMWRRGPIWQAVAVNPDLLEAVGQCIGQAFYPWNDSLVVKLPHSGAAVHWHQDPPYSDPARTATYPVPNFTTDIYLDHSGPDNGCVYAIPGRHLEGHMNMSPPDADGESLFDNGRAVPLEMEAGDVLFHWLSTPHGSRPNLSASQRRIFYVHYLCDEVYQDAYASAPWAAEKPSWGGARRALCEEMLASRVATGFEPAETRDTLDFGEGGFSVECKMQSAK